MRKVVLDTDLFSECVKGKNQLVGERHDAYISIHERLTITSWTVFEVLTGNYHRLPEKLEFYDHLLQKAEEIVPNSEDYRMAAKIEGSLLQIGKPVRDIDPLIAACAITRGLPIATGNTKHYIPIIELGYALQLENWRVPTEP